MCLLGHPLILLVLNVNFHFVLSFIRISPILAHLIMGFIYLMVHGCLPVLFLTLFLFYDFISTRFAQTLLHNTLHFHVRCCFGLTTFNWLWFTTTCGCISFTMWIGSLDIIKIVSNRFQTQQTNLESLTLIYFSWAYNLGLLHIKSSFLGNNPNAFISILQTFHLHSCFFCLYIW